MRAWSTAFLASKRFMPCETDEAVQHEKLVNETEAPSKRRRLTFGVTEWTCTHCRGNNDNETPYQEGRRHVNEQAILIQDVDEGQIVSLSNLVVIMVMGWGDFDST